MSSIQNADVKGIPELDALGLPHSHLIHDTKIWVSSEGINRTLHDAILDRAIGLKGTAGAQIKDYSLFNKPVPLQVGSPVCALFDGSQHLRIDREEFTFQNSFTMVTWVNSNNLSSAMDLITKWGLVGNRQYKLHYNEVDSRFEFEVNKADNSSEVVFDTFTPSINTWYSIVARYEKGVGISIKVGSGAWKSTPFTLPLSTNAVEPLIVGEGFKGKIDSTSFFDRCLTDVEVDEILDSGAGKAFEVLSVPLKQAIVAQWDLDETSGNRNSKGSTRTYTLIEVGNAIPSDVGHVVPFLDENVNIYGATLDLDGNTVIAVPWSFRSDSLITVNLGLEHLIEWISDEVTPDAWFKKDVNDGSLIIKGDVILNIQNEPIVIQSLVGVPPPSSAIRIVTGLQPLNEAYGKTSSITGSSSVEEVFVVDFKTRIKFTFDLDPDNLQLLYVNNTFWPKYNPSVPNINYFKQIDGNTIELSEDFSIQNFNFYFAYFAQVNVVDDLGNLCIPLTPYFRSFSLASPNLTTWAIGVNDFGELVTNDLYNTIPEPIRFRRDDLSVCELTVDLEGNLQVNDAPIGTGILFDNMHFESPNGSVWSLGITNENSLYVIDEDGRVFCIKDGNGNITYKVQQLNDGALVGYRYYPEGSELPIPTFEEENETVFCYIDIGDGFHVMHYFDQDANTWLPMQLSNTDRSIGEVLETTLTPEQALPVYGAYWKPMNGEVELDINNYPEFAQLMPEWLDLENGVIKIPKSQVQCFGALAEYGPADRDWRVNIPEFFNKEDLLAGISTIRRTYWATSYNQTNVNDFYHGGRVNGPAWGNDGKNGQVYGYISPQRSESLERVLVIYKSSRRITRYIKVK